ncbi:MAG: 4a-hydroxytetrahydrobiopterin dehydratase, partial [Actinomycetia bacterium]|nr:4a-hydroxytetrahydrobiopterin dehydratase [Actinomycetes bacterium]
MKYTRISPAQFADLEGLDDWRYHLGAVHAHFHAGSFPAAIELTTRIGDAAKAIRHHPDITITYPDLVGVSLMTHATGGLTTFDVDLARQISGLAAATGASPDPKIGQSVEVTIDILDLEACVPFWAAVMGGYSRRGDRVLVDPLRNGPTI